MSLLLHEGASRLASNRRVSVSTSVATAATLRNDRLNKSRRVVPARHHTMYKSSKRTHEDSAAA